MGNCISISNSKQVVFFEIVDAIIKQQISGYTVSENLKPVTQRLINALRKDFSNAENLDEYFEFKLLLFTSPQFNNNPANNFLALCNIPSRYKGFKMAVEAFEKVLAILMELDETDYDHLAYAAFQKMREAALNEIPNLEAVLHTDKTISFRFKDFHHLNEAHLNYFISDRWFLGFNQPLFNIENDIA